MSNAKNLRGLTLLKSLTDQKDLFVGISPSLPKAVDKIKNDVFTRRKVLLATDKHQVKYTKFFPFIQLKVNGELLPSCQTQAEMAADFYNDAAALATLSGATNHDAED